MKVRLLDILACPDDKQWPLVAHRFEEKEITDISLPKPDTSTNVVCKYYCGRKNIILVDEENGEVTKEASYIKYDVDCKECFTKEIISGLIVCPKCGNYYPIIEEIPMMVKEELRNEDIEREFTNKWADKIKELIE